MQGNGLDAARKNRLHPVPKILPQRSLESCRHNFCVKRAIQIDFIGMVEVNSRKNSNHGMNLVLR